MTLYRALTPAMSWTSSASSASLPSARVWPAGRTTTIATADGLALRRFGLAARAARESQGEGCQDGDRMGTAPNTRQIRWVHELPFKSVARPRVAGAILGEDAFLLPRFQRMLRSRKAFSTNKVDRSMRTKPLHALARPLLVLCGVWIVFAPVLSQVHQAFANHRHVFCPEHNRIEDEPSTIGLDAGDLASVDRDSDAPTCGVVQALACGATEEECLFSNFSAHASIQRAGRLSGVSSAVAIDVRPLRDVNLRSLDTLRVAPKNSPPRG